METKTERWTLRVTKSQDSIVRQALAATGMSLNDYVVSNAVGSATNDLADRTFFALGPEEWDQLADALDRPLTNNSSIAELLQNPSVLENE